MQASWMLLGCLFTGCNSETETPPDTEGDTNPIVEAFELIGTWEYVGSMAGLTNQLTVTEEEMADVGDYNGTGWNIVFAIETWDNDADQSLVNVASIEGFSHYELGESLYMSWSLSEDTMNLYVSTSGFQEPSGGTEGDQFVTYSRL